MPLLVGEAALPSHPSALVHAYIGLDVVVVVVMAVGVFIIGNSKSFNLVPQNLEQNKENLLQ